MKSKIIFGLFFALVGILAFVKELSKRKNCKVLTEATIIDIVRETSRDSEGNTTRSLIPILKYTVSGNIYVKESSSSSRTSYIGKKVKIYYNFQNPNEFYIKGSLGGVITGLIFSIIGIAILYSSIAN